MRIPGLLIAAIAAGLAAAPAPAPAEGTEQGEALVTFKVMRPEVALDLARAALRACREQGYQVAVAVVDRFGATQVVLRDRFAGSHTVGTATGKAWTAVSFRTPTLELDRRVRDGSLSLGLRNVPGALVLGGGLPVEAQGTIVGGIGVSGAPGPDIDEACARAGIEAISDRLEF